MSDSEAIAAKAISGTLTANERERLASSCSQAQAQQMWASVKGLVCTLIITAIGPVSCTVGVSTVTTRAAIFDEQPRGLERGWFVETVDNVEVETTDASGKRSKRSVGIDELEDAVGSEAAALTSELRWNSESVCSGETRGRSWNASSGRAAVKIGGALFSSSKTVTVELRPPGQPLIRTRFKLACRRAP